MRRRASSVERDPAAASGADQVEGLEVNSGPFLATRSSGVNVLGNREQEQRMEPQAPFDSVGSVLAVRKPSNRQVLASLSSPNGSLTLVRSRRGHSLL